MTHRLAVETQTKCRRLFYAKVDFLISTPDGDQQILAGDVMAVASGGGAIADLTGDDLIVATYNDHTAVERIGCIEEFFHPVPATRPLKVDLTKVQPCCDAVEAHRNAAKAEAEFVFETGIKLFGSEQRTTGDLQHLLKVQEMHTRDNPSRTSDHDDIVQAQTDLEALCRTCDDCSEQLLITRDAAITFAGPAA